MYVDGAVKRIQLAAAHRLHDLVAREHAARALGQRDQQVELVRGEVGHLPATVTVRASRSISSDKKRSAGAWQRGAAIGAPAQDGADARQQLRGSNGLGR